MTNYKLDFIKSRDGSRHAAKFVNESCPFTNFNRELLFNTQVS